jgi:S-DNA-T family DNA segregation ATPase FtsK/SpoIIIE
MLFTPAWDPVPVRIQGAYLGEEEIEALTAYVKTLGEPEYIDEAMFLDDDEEDVPFDAVDDPLMDKALEIIVTAGKASASYLQRRLQIGYNRAARLVEAMEQQGIVGPAQGSKPREILHVPERARD